MTPEDLAACADIVRRGDPERFMAAMAAPVAARRVLFPLYAFNVEVARAPWVTQEPLIAQMRLQWWRDALHEIGTETSVRRHEVVTPLAGILDARGAALLDDLIVARYWDIERDPFEDDAHFNRYLRHTGGHLMWVAARALGARDDAGDAVLGIGTAHGLTNLLRAIPALEQAGRIPLVDGRPAALRDLARDALDTFRAARPDLPKRAKPALLPAWKVAPILRRVLSDPSRVADGTLDISPLRSRWRLLTRAFIV